MIVVVQHTDERLLKYALPLPLLESAVTGLPRPELTRDRAPLTAGAQSIDDPAEDGAVIVSGATTVRFRALAGQE